MKPKRQEAEETDADDVTHPKKQARADTEEDDEDEEDEDAHGEIIDVDFDYFDPKEIDFHGLKSLLNQTFGNDASEFDVSGIADLVLKNAFIGSVVKADGVDDPYAVMTILPLAKEKPMEAVKKYILDKCKKHDPDHLEKLTGLVESKNIGILINERLINMPPQIVVPLLKMTIEEHQKAFSEKKIDFRYDYVLLISKTYTEVDPLAADADSDSRPKKKKKSKQKHTAVQHFHVEDELFEKHCDFKFDFPFTNQNDLSELIQTAGINAARRIYIVDVKKLPKIQSDMNEVVV